MTSPQKRKGDAFERDVRDFLLADGWSFVARVPAGATLDVGDLLLPADIPATIDCKNHRTVALGPWIDRAGVQAANAGRISGWTCVKRHGTSDPARAFMVTDLEMWSDFVQRLRGTR